MHTKPRNGAAIEKIVLHDPEGANTARELLNFLNGISAGYHWLSDDNELIVAATDDLIVEGAGGMNTHALHGCVVPGRAAWSRSEWLVHRPAIERLGRKVGEKCKEHDIPPRLLTPGEVATPGVKGICRHWDVTLAGFTASEGHTDPGPNFPLDVFMAAVTGIVIPPAPKEPEDVIVIACPNKPALSPTKQPHALFLPPSQLVKNGGVALRHGANIKGSKDGLWSPSPIAPGRKWVSMFEKLGELLDEHGLPDPKAFRSKGVTLVDDHGETTTVEQGLWI